VGRDPNTGIVYSEIPDSFYGVESVVLDTSFDPPPTTEDKGVVTLYVINPIQDDFLLTPYSPEDEAQFSVASYDRNGEISDFEFPEGSQGEYEVVYSPEPGSTFEVIRKVEIDVKPRDGKNIIYSITSGILPIAVLTTPDFDATQIDVRLVNVGQGQATSLFRKTLKIDVDRDRDKDMLMFFKMADIGFNQGDTQLCLEGKLSSGEIFKGCDSIQISERPRPDFDILYLLRLISLL